MKIEEIMIKGKKAVVIRDDRGKIIDQTYKMDLEDARNLYKQQGTFRKDLHKTELTNYTEYTQTINTSKLYTGKKVKKTNIKTFGAYQYYVSGQIMEHKRVKTIVATSTRHPKSYPVSQAKEEAWEIFWRRFNATTSGVSDPSVNEKAIKKLHNIREGFIYYVPKVRVSSSDSA